MTSVEFSVDFAPGYTCEGNWVEIASSSHVISFELEPGRHEFESRPFEIGTLRKFEGRKLLALVAFTYEFDPESMNVSICAADLASRDTLRLITYPADSEEFCHQRSFEGGLIHDDLGRNPNWNYLGPLTPGCEPFLRHVAGSAITSLKKALIAQGNLGVEMRGPPPKLSREDFFNTLMVCHKGEFVEYHDPAKVYPEQYSHITIESTYQGTYTFAKNADFANVIGSTNDPKVPGYKSWIKLWEDKCNNGGSVGTTCASTGFPQNFTCNTPIYGGHIVTGTLAITPAKNSTVYIIPICNAHNSTDMSYMQAINWRDAVVLKYWAKASGV